MKYHMANICVLLKYFDHVPEMKKIYSENLMDEILPIFKCFRLINNKIFGNQLWDVNYGKGTGIMFQFRSWTWRQHLLTAQSLRTLQFARKVHQWKLFRLQQRTSIAIC